MNKKAENKGVPKDGELDKKVKKCMERISENIHISANEPSLALYRLQEHVRRALPPTVSRRQHVLQLHSQLQGACYDVEYALGAVLSMKDSESKLIAIQDMLKDGIFYKKQLKYEQTRRKHETSMYKRLSSHLTSFDLPDFPDAIRETASRVESALQHARSSYESHHSKKDKMKDDLIFKEEGGEENTNKEIKENERMKTNENAGESKDSTSEGDDKYVRQNKEKSSESVNKQTSESDIVDYI